MTTQSPASHSAAPTAQVSPTGTAVDLPAATANSGLKRTTSPVVSLHRQISGLGRTLSNSATAYAASAHPEGVAEEPIRRVLTDMTGAEIKLSQGRKWFLLLIFSVAQVSISASL